MCAGARAERAVQSQLTPLGEQVVSAGQVSVDAVQTQPTAQGVGGVWAGRDVAQTAPPQLIPSQGQCVGVKCVAANAVHGQPVSIMTSGAHAGQGGVEYGPEPKPEPVPVRKVTIYCARESVVTRVVRAEPGHIALEGATMEALLAAGEGRIAALKWGATEAPDSEAILAVRDKAVASKLRFPKTLPDGRVAKLPPAVQWDLLTEAAKWQQDVARMLVLCCGGGGWSAGMRGVS